MKPEIMNIQNVLKQHIKAQGHSYETLAKKMTLSTATIKRLLNGADPSLERLIKLCHLLEINFTQVVAVSEHITSMPHRFTLSQEKVLAKSHVHFQYFRLLILGYDTKEIAQQLKLTSAKSLQYLKAFESVELLERWPNDRIKLLVKFPFEWQDDGPLHQTYTDIITKKALSMLQTYGINSKNQKNNSICHATELALSHEHYQNYQNDLKELMKKYRDLSQVELKNRQQDRVVCSTLFMLGEFSWLG